MFPQTYHAAVFVSNLRDPFHVKNLPCDVINTGKQNNCDWFAFASNHIHDFIHAPQFAVLNTKYPSIGKDNRSAHIFIAFFQSSIQKIAHRGQKLGE